MKIRSAPVLIFFFLALTGLSAPSNQAAAQADVLSGGGAAVGVPSVDLAQVDDIFETFDGTRTPGCAVGVSLGGSPVLLRAYGMADLEHDVPNRPETIFEPGSVSKQFTAAATILLVLDGKLSLDDDVRKYIPEVPDYGEVITIRHLLHHTSGLRDWGSIAGIEGWPRTRRAHTHAHVLDIVNRQLSLNYSPGEYYSYTNTGFNLLAILVGRVSGMPFAEFSKERIFEPLGMTRTQWRDDFTRVVKDRAMAYRGDRDGNWSTLMPFENVHGNGGLLTTVEDLLKFTWNLETGEVGGPRFIEEMHRQSVLNSGQVHFYASGLQIREYKGLPIVEHSGSTAGYRGHLTRFPDQKLALAVMCNTTTGNAGALLREVADLYLGDLAQDADPPSPPPTVDLPPERLEAVAGRYRVADGARRGTLFTVVSGNDRLNAAGTELFPVADNRFQSARGTVLQFDGEPMAQGRPWATLNPGTEPVRLEPVPAFLPTPSQLRDYVGIYRSDEAEATYRMVVEEGSLVMKDRWGEGRPLQPLYPDAFGARGATLIFRRDASGQVVEMSWSEDRVWDLRFRRVE